MNRFLLTAFAALLLAACSAPPQPTPVPTPVPTPTPTPRELSAAVGRATQASESVNFVIELSGKPVKIDSTGITVLNTMTGDLKRPDGVLALLDVNLGSTVTEIRTVSLAGKQYITNPITRQWTCLAPGAAFDPAVLFAPDRGIEYLLQEEFQDVSLVGREAIDGRPQIHLRGTIDGPQLQAISLNLVGAGPVAVDLWADVETLRATRIVLVDTATDPTEPTTWTVSFSDYDKTVEVRAPVECPA